MQLAYMAGIMDGEGSVGVYRNGQGLSHSLSVQVRQNLSPQVLQLIAELQQAFGGRLHTQKTKPGSTFCNWALSGLEAVAFLEAILPYLRFKKEQSEIAIAWFKSKPTMQRNARGHNISHPPEVFEEGERVGQLLRDMKKPVNYL